MRKITRAQALESFRLLIEEVSVLERAALTNQSPYIDGFERWKIASETSIHEVFGSGHQNITEFQNISFLAPRLPGETPDTNKDLIFFMFGMKRAKEMLEGMAISIAICWPEDSGQIPAQPIVFLSYGGFRQKKTLLKIKEFLIAFGASPLDVVEMPNTGKTLDDKVMQAMQICNTAIVLLTGEDIMIDGEIRVRPNVDHEVGALQQCVSINKRIIYFKEKDVTIPSNYRNIAWHEYHVGQIDEIYIKIIKELKAFGF